MNAVRLAFSGRRERLRLQADWLWAAELVVAFEKLNHCPAAAGQEGLNAVLRR